MTKTWVRLWKRAYDLCDNLWICETKLITKNFIIYSGNLGKHKYQFYCLVLPTLSPHFLYRILKLIRFFYRTLVSGIKRSGGVAKWTLNPTLKSKKSLFRYYFKTYEVLKKFRFFSILLPDAKKNTVFFFKHYFV